MNRETIMVAIARLETLAASGRHFDMESWGRDAQCGFAGCLVGWACRQDWFREHGFRMRLIPGETVDGAGYHPRIYDWRGGENYLSIGIENGMAEIFGVGIDTIDMIIYSSSYPADEVDVDMVARRLRYLLEFGEDEFKRDIKCQILGLTEDSHDLQDQ